MTQPSIIPDTTDLDELLSEPTPAVIQTLARLEGDIIVLGAAGKMGPTLTRMIRRATDAAGSNRRVIAVSRFSSLHSQEEFHQHNIETIRCDLLQQSELDALPDVPNVVYMAGMKFGSTGNESLTWAMNSYLPGMVCVKYRNSKIVAFSTGNVYPLTPVSYGGSVETDPTSPIGDYAQSCLGRERIFEHFSRTWDIPLAILRLTYATEMRYGVLTDIARKVFQGETIHLAMGNVNVIWQGDANAMSLQAFDHVASPPFVVNIAGAEILSLRRVAQQFGTLFGVHARLEGEEKPDALLINGQLSHRLFGYPHIGVQQMMVWIADWVQRGGESLSKPTHFETRDGKF
jgi:nucleoside-diphosphate-sugar epimerase